LKEAIFPEKTKTISNYAFQNCTSLEKVYIPQSTKTIGSYAFKGCEKLSDLTIADYSITAINSETFMDCPGLTKVVLPKGLKSIGSKAFMNCTSLIEVVIPESVTSIDSTAFSYPEKTTIFGKTGSYAETFAKENSFKFVDYSVPCEGLALADFAEYIVMDRGETYRAKFEFYPEESTDVVTLTASNNKVTINGHDIYCSSTGDTVITATASSGVTYEFTIHIRDVSNISITNAPTKLSYVIGEELDLSGMKVQVNYGDGSTREVSDYTVSGFDSSAEGNCTVTVKWVSAYGYSYTKTFTVEIVNPAPKLTGIFVSTLPDKLSYSLREKLDLTGLVIMGSYTDGSEAEITGYTTSGYNALKKGTQTITVKYEDFTTTFNVEVGVAKTLTSVTVSTMPTKLVYVVGETIDSTGMKLTLTYSDKTTEVVTTGFTLTGFDSETAGEKTVTVTYSGVNTTFTVTVIEPDNFSEWFYTRNQTTAVAYIDKLGSNYTVTVYNKKGVAVDANSILGTGMTLEIVNLLTSQTYTQTVVIYGDVSGDGYVKAMDYMKIKKSITNNTLSEAEFLAADLNGDGLIKAADYMKVKRFIKGEYDIYEGLE